MKNQELNALLSAWRAEAKVRNGIAYKTFCPRDSDGCLLSIYTAQPMRMENLISKYHPLLAKLPMFKGNLTIDIVKVDRCIH